MARRYVGALNTLVPTLNSATAKMPQSASMTMPIARTAFGSFGQQLAPPQHQTQSHVQHSVPFPLQDLASPLSRMTTRTGSESLDFGPISSYLSSLAHFEVHQSDPPHTLARPLVSCQARPQSQPISNQQFQQSQQSDVLQAQKWQQYSPFTAFMEPTGKMNTHHRFGLGAKLTGNSSNGNSDGNGKQSASTESKSFGTSISINTLKSDLFAPPPWHPIEDNKRTINEALKETNSLTTLQNGPHQQQGQLGLNKAAVKIGLDVQDENKRPMTNTTGSTALLGNTAEEECGGLGVRGMQDRWQVSPDWWQVFL